MRLIDADRLFEAIYDNVPAPYEDASWAKENCLAEIDAAPTVDAVPVVRCRECKQGEIGDPDFPDEYYCHEGCGWNKGDFYCAYGERKEGAD